MNPILTTIYSTSYTTVDLFRRIGILQRTLEEVLFHEDTGSLREKRAMDYVQKNESASDAEALSHWGSVVWDAFSSQNLASMISGLKKEVAQLPVITLYVPVALDEAATIDLGAWARSADGLGVMTLFDVQVDAGVIGGCAIVLGDTYHDLSFKGVMASHRGAITQLLSSYA